MSYCGWESYLNEVFRNVDKNSMISYSSYDTICSPSFDLIALREFVVLCPHKTLTSGSLRVCVSTSRHLVGLGRAKTD